LDNTITDLANNLIKDEIQNIPNIQNVDLLKGLARIAQRKCLVPDWEQEFEDLEPTLTDEEKNQEEWQALTALSIHTAEEREEIKTTYASRQVGGDIIRELARVRESKLSQ
jgi:hypothetical protein